MFRMENNKEKKEFKTIDEQIAEQETIIKKLMNSEGKLNTPDKKRKYATARNRLEELRGIWLDVDENRLPKDPYYDLEEKVSYHPHCMNCDCFPAGSSDCKNRPNCDEEEDD